MLSVSLTATCTATGASVMMAAAVPLVVGLVAAGVEEEVAGVGDRQPAAGMGGLVRRGLECACTGTRSATSRSRRRSSHEGSRSSALGVPKRIVQCGDGRVQAGVRGDTDAVVAGSDGGGTYHMIICIVRNAQCAYTYTYA